ncbi:MAG TPA: hypothetical protein VGI72_12295 [Gaiellales bacterium]
MSAEPALLATVVVVIPGLAASLALYPDRDLGLATRLASVWAFGYALVALVAIGLALASTLGRGWFLAGYVVVCAGAWGLAARRRGWRSARPSRPAPPGWPAVAGLAGLAVFAVYHWSLSPYMQFGVSTPFRYWADGLELAQAHDIPARTLQWGTHYPTTVSKVAFNAFGAGQSLILQTSSLQAIAALTWLGAIGLFLALWAVGDQLGLRWTAPLLPLLLLAVPGGWPLENAMSQDIVLFRAENFGRLVALTALALAVYSLRRGAAMVQLAATGALLGVAALIHLIPVVVVAAMLLLYAVAAAVGSLPVRSAVVRFAAIGGTAVLAYALLLAASRGSLGLQGAQSTTSYTSYPGGVDPTAYFRTGHPVLFAPGESAAQLVQQYAERGLAAGSGEVGAAYAALGLLALTALAVVVFLERRLAPVVAAAVGLAIVLVIAAIGFAHHYTVMIQSTFGERRLFDYAGLSVALLLLVVAEALAVRAGRLQPILPAAMVGVGVAVLLATSIHTPATLKRWQGAATTAGVTHSVFDLVSRRVPCDARILPNFRSEGVFEAVTGRRSVMEGMSPYLRPAMLDRVLGLVKRARTFFHDPNADRAFVAAERVDYVLMIPQDMVIGEDGIPYRRLPLPPVPWLHLVGTASGARLYAVAGAAHVVVAGAGQPATCRVIPGSGS